MCIRTLSVYTLLFCLLIFNAEASRHLRHGPADGGDKVTVRGTAIVDEYWEPNSGERNKVGWSAELKKDIVTWYDLEKDDVDIASCSSTHVELSGSMLDQSDYEKGTVFVIDAADWENNCRLPEVQEDIPEEDDVFFYLIEDVEIKEDSNIHLTIKRISGEEVVPEVILDVGEDQGESAPGATAGEVTLFDEDEPVARQAVSVPTMSRALPDLARNLTIVTGVNLDFSASVGAGISGFRLKRLIGLRFTWEQRLFTEASATFTVSAALEAERQGRLVQIPIPGFGFRSPRIPFVGRASAGAFVRVDWVLELNAQTTMNAFFDVRREIRQRVDAKIFPPDFKATSLAPLEPNSESSSLELGAVAEVGITGFAGVRPALGVEVRLGKKSAGGNIGVKAGVELEIKGRFPPFEPVTAEGRKLGVCDECHALEGSLGIKIKDLSLQLERKQEVTRELVLVEDIFGITLATVCGAPLQCGFIPPPTTPPPQLPEPSVSPSPPPKRRGSCKRCRRTRDCRAGETCRGARLIKRGKCHLRLRQGERCGGKCTLCNGGSFE